MLSQHNRAQILVLKVQAAVQDSNSLDVIVPLAQLKVELDVVFLQDE